jgi:hypothetical protein
MDRADAVRTIIDARAEIDPDLGQRRVNAPAGGVSDCHAPIGSGEKVSELFQVLAG